MFFFCAENGRKIGALTIEIVKSIFMACFKICRVKFGLKYLFCKDEPSEILNRHQELGI